MLTLNVQSRNGVKKMSLRKFLFMVENEVVSDFLFDDRFPLNASFADGIANNSLTMVPIPDGVSVGVDYYYVDGQFYDRIN